MHESRRDEKVLSMSFGSNRAATAGFLDERSSSSTYLQALGGVQNVMNQ
jgi:hypothetical protein